MVAGVSKLISLLPPLPPIVLFSTSPQDDPVRMWVRSCLLCSVLPVGCPPHPACQLTSWRGPTKQLTPPSGFPLILLLPSPFCGFAIQAHSCLRGFALQWKTLDKHIVSSSLLQVSSLLSAYQWGFFWLPCLKLQLLFLHHLPALPALFLFYNFFPSVSSDMVNILFIYKFLPQILSSMRAGTSGFSLICPHHLEYLWYTVGPQNMFVLGLLNFGSPGKWLDIWFCFVDDWIPPWQCLLPKPLSERSTGPPALALVSYLISNSRASRSSDFYLSLPSNWVSLPLTKVCVALNIFPSKVYYECRKNVSL